MHHCIHPLFFPSMKVPPKRKGNLNRIPHRANHIIPSMKVPPKRKGNLEAMKTRAALALALNESPSEKEGKFKGFPVLALHL